MRSRLLTSGDMPRGRGGQSPWFALTSTIAAGVMTCMLCMACASSRPHHVPPDVYGGGTDDDSISSDSTVATVTVENQRSPDMTIYVVGLDGIRIRLGFVHGHDTAKFAIPKSVLIGTVTDLRLIADPIGGDVAGISEKIQVSPGDDIVMTIPPT